MQPILVLMAPGFEEIELTAPVDILRRLGVPVTLAGLRSRTVEGAHGLQMQADMLLVDVEPEKFSGVVLPGGGGAWVLKDTPAVLKLVRHMHAEGKTVGAICAAPMVLQAAGIAEGRRITCYPAEDVTKVFTGATTLCADPAVTDGHIVTGRGPGAALEFGFALACALGKEAEVPALRKAMCV